MSSADPVRFAIIGLGMGRNRAKLATETEGAELAVVCSLDEARARDTAREFNCDWSTSFAEVVHRDDVDVVGILTPSGTHCRLAVEALQAGKHVFTTKPLDIQVAVCDQAIAAARAADRLLAVDFGSRYAPLNRRIREAVRSGLLGRVFLADLQMKWYRGQAYYDGGDPPGWRSRRATEGGSLANQGVHYIDLLQWFIGPVERVRGRVQTVNHEIETEDCCNALLTFENGCWGVVATTTASTPNLGTRIEISGTGGTISWANNRLERFVLEEDPEAELEQLLPDPGGPQHIIEDMVSAVRQGTAPAVDGPEGRRTVALFEAVYRSAAEDREVCLAEL